MYLLLMQLLCFHCFCCRIVFGVSVVATNAAIVVSVDIYLMQFHLFCSCHHVPVVVSVAVAFLLLQLSYFCRCLTTVYSIIKDAAAPLLPFSDGVLSLMQPVTLMKIQIMT